MLTERKQSKMVVLKMKVKFIYLLIFLSGCHKDFLVKNYSRTEVGIGKPIFISKTIIRNGKGNPVDIVHESSYIETKVFKVKNIETAVGLGISGAQTINGQDCIGTGLDLKPRIIYPIKSFELYFSLKAGFHYFDHKPNEQATNWGFVLGAGPGIGLKTSENTSIFAQYEVWHFSNGSSIFGSPRPNRGINTDVVSLGIEYRF